jgi:UDP-N-acetylmuramoyl-L-alanyl-D-glutamate--2,6-diaminopimelate ligase
MTLLLSDLQARLQRAGLICPSEGNVSTPVLWIDHLANDSRKVGTGGLYIAIRGEQADGHLFIDKAVQNGAVAVVCEAMPDEVSQRFPGIACIPVTSSRAALAELAAAWYGDPAHALTMVGVTGTNGKTTTTFLVHYLLTTLGQTTGLMGTIQYRFGGAPVEATHTTPDALDLHRMLRQMVDAGCTACVMEVSSHALDQERVRGIPYQVAVFSNLTQDHLDYHQTFTQYFQAKKTLFDGLQPGATALYNDDDPAGADMVAATKARKLAFGQSPAADLRMQVLENRVEGLRLRIQGRERLFRLVGQFNAYNLVAAFGVGIALGYDPDRVLEALATAPPVPGRFEQFRFGDGTTVIVDYAHTPDALEKVLRTLRDLRPPGASLWCLFGCGGNRDAGKRPLMGALAEQYADNVVVTSDNPRTEDPEAILHDIRRGLAHPEAAYWIVDRRAAIGFVARQARPGDVVLVAGKGHENYQILGQQKVSLDDREEVRQQFAFRGEAP